MNKREDYEHLEREVDGSYYWWINNDVIHLSKFGNCEHEDLYNLSKWFYNEESKVCSLYYKMTRLYFTYKDVKYYLSWVFFSQDLINEAIKRLRSIGAINLQINYGELD